MCNEWVCCEHNAGVVFEISTWCPVILYCDWCICHHMTWTRSRYIAGGQKKELLPRTVAPLPVDWTALPVGGANHVIKQLMTGSSGNAQPVGLGLRARPTDWAVALWTSILLPWCCCPGCMRWGKELRIAPWHKHCLNLAKHLSCNKTTDDWFFGQRTTCCPRARVLLPSEPVTSCIIHHGLQESGATTIFLLSQSGVEKCVGLHHVAMSFRPINIDAYGYAFSDPTEFKTGCPSYGTER